MKISEFYRYEELLLALLLVFGVWLNFDLNIAGARVQGLLSICVLFLVSLIYFLKSGGKGLVSICGFLIAVIVFSWLSAGGLEGSPELVKGVVQYGVYFSLSACFVHVVLGKVSWQFGLKLVYFVMSLVIALIFIETMFSGVFDSIKSSMYSLSLYESFDRDERVYGFARPTALNREPAHLGVLCCFLSVLLVKVNRNLSSLFVSAAFLLFCLFMVRTPIAVMGFFLIFYEYYKDRIGLFTVLLTVLCGVLGVFLVEAFFAERVANILSGDDFSFLARIMGPVLVLIDVIREYPFFGLGIGADDVLYGFVFDMFVEYGFYSRLLDMDFFQISKMVTSYFWMHFIAFGLLGGFGIFYAYVFFLKNIFKINSSWSVMVPFLLMGLLIGGLVTMKVWIMWAFLTIYQKMQEEKESESRYR